jgi:hypothetical protein
LAPPAPAKVAADASANDGGSTLGAWSHAYVTFGGTPKYPKGFKNFEQRGASLIGPRNAWSNALGRRRRPAT